MLPDPNFNEDPDIRRDFGCHEILTCKILSFFLSFVLIHNFEENVDRCVLVYSYWGILIFIYELIILLGVVIFPVKKNLQMLSRIADLVKWEPNLQARLQLGETGDWNVELSPEKFGLQASSIVI